MDSGYSIAATPASGPSSGAGQSKKEGYWTVDQCKKAYLDYLFNKVQEVEEQKQARRYYHGSHWTAEQIKALNKRKQPVVTFNRIARKIDGTVGLLERLRQDPKAYPRTPQHEQGAELATSVLRYVLDEEEWKAKSPEVARKGAIDGVAGVEIEITQGDQGDPEVSFELVEPDSFFYDPRSYRADFSDARYMGVGKWMDQDAAIEMFPQFEDDIRAVGTYSSELSTNPDREKRWFTEVGAKRLIRLIEVWYKHKGKWCWSIFTGYSILMEGASYLIDNKNKTFCKYIMFSANVDHDGDRYGFVRNLKSPQDEYNHRRSKSLHQANSKRLILAQGAVQDIETVRREWARPDGVVVVQSASATEGAKADDQSFDFAGQLKLMENAVSELENYGPNQALIGDQTNQSGRAIQLLQQAGMAELGPFILAYRGWKVRLYRAIWNTVQKYWTSERWIRVTDDQAAVNFVPINQEKRDEFGRPIIVNPLGQLDVDIIIDEGPDTINAQQDVYESLSNILPTVGQMLSPLEIRAAVGVLIESSALPFTAKKAFKDAATQAAQMPPPPNPELEKAKIQLEAKQQEKAADLQFKREDAAESRMIDWQKHLDQMEMDREKAARQVEIERVKAAIAASHKRDELAAHVHTEREKALIARESRQSEMDDRGVMREAETGRGIEMLASAMSEMAAGITRMSEGISEMAENIDELGDVLTAPKQLVFDKSGNPIGSKTVKKVGRAKETEAAE